jgi:hypothetical protein
MLRAPDRRILFPAGNHYRHQKFDLQGTFDVAAAQQSLDTMSLNKPRHHIHSGI